jgi:hypothetical protein
MTTASFPTAIAEKASAAALTPRVPASTNTEGDDFFGDDGLTFEDFLDLVNPLQHIPIVSTVYRAMTGDKISTGARVLGGALFGGILGLMSAVANAIIVDATGKDIGEHALAVFYGSDDEPESAVASAARSIGTHGVNPYHGLEPPVGTSLSRAATTAIISGVPTETESTETGARGPAKDYATKASAPQIRGDEFNIAVRFGNQEPAISWVLLVLEQALGKYNEGTLRASRTYERRTLAWGRPAGAVDTIA